MKQGGYTVRFERLEFVNTSQRIKWTAPFRDIFWDLDGSLTGSVNGTTSPFTGFNNWPSECEQKSLLLDSGIVCNYPVRLRRLQIDGVDPREVDCSELLDLLF
jgi:hypothetical protein